MSKLASIISGIRMDEPKNGDAPSSSFVPTTTVGTKPVPPSLVHRTQFVEDTDQPPLSMHDIHDALGAKRTEQKLAIKRLSEIQTERAKAMQAMLILAVLDKEERDIIEKFDA